jgi:hypothetical protein
MQKKASLILPHIMTLLGKMGSPHFSQTDFHPGIFLSPEQIEGCEEHPQNKPGTSHVRFRR